MEVPFIWRFAFLAAEDAQSALNILSLSKRIYNHISPHDIMVAHFRRWCIRNMNLRKRCKHLCGNNTDALRALHQVSRYFEIEVEHLHDKLTQHSITPVHFVVTKPFHERFFVEIAGDGHLVLFKSMIREFHLVSHRLFRNAFDMALALNHVNICRFILHYPHDVIYRNVSEGFGIDVHDALYTAAYEHALFAIHFLVLEEGADVLIAALSHPTGDVFDFVNDPELPSYIRRALARFLREHLA